MTESNGKGGHWLKYGCFGCLGLLALILIVAGTAVGLAFYQAKTETVEERVLTHAVPGAAGSAEAGDAVVPSGDAAAATRPGKITLDISGVECRIEPGRPGQPIRVEVSYSENDYVLEETFDDGTEGWTYDLRFARRSRGSFVTGLKEALTGSAPKLRVVLPPGTPTMLDLELSEGGGEIRLGGLWLTETEIRFSRGGFLLEIDEPFAAPAERFSIRGSMGGFQAVGLGNASPRRLDVDVRLGGMELDLRGLWLTDSDISLKTSLGGGEVRLPRDVTIEGLDRGGPRAAPDEEIQRPVLRFTAISESGGLEFTD